MEKRKIIGICGARIFTENTMNIINGIRNVSKAYGYLPVVFSAISDTEEENDTARGERELFELVRYIDVSALVILAESETIKNYNLIDIIVRIGKAAGIPVFCVGHIIEGCYYLHMDYHSGFEQMVRHIVEDHGFRRVNMLAGFKGNNISEERVAIYKKVLEENGIPFEEERLAYGDFWDRPARIAVQGFLDSDIPLPEAIVCANDSMAIVACAEANARGYQIPEDIVITGFDGISLGKYYHPRLSTCSPDFVEMADFIIEETEHFVETGEFIPKEFSIKFRLEQSQSCGCRPKNTYGHNHVMTKLNVDLGDCGWHAIAMNTILNNSIQERDIRALFKKLPETEIMWSDHFRFACIKSEIIKENYPYLGYHEMEIILRGNHEVFDEPGEIFDIGQFIPNFDQILCDEEIEILVVGILHVGKAVFGYTAEAFKELDQRSVQRGIEFSMFLSNAINYVLHNRELSELNQNLSKAYEDIAVLSNQDALTGLCNRRGFYQEYKQLCLETDAPYLVVLSVDMNRLKYINDNYGHIEGDFAIVTLAHAIQKTCLEFTAQSVCARFGGDEFSCVLFVDEPDSVKEQEFRGLIDRYIAETPHVKEKDYPITASLGLKAQKITDADNIEDVIREADQLMYKDKGEARRKY